MFAPYFEYYAIILRGAVFCGPTVYIHRVSKNVPPLAYTHLAKSGKTIIFCWIPSHVNIRGNERADAVAKSALSLSVTNMKLPAHELLPCMSNFCLDEWQDIWDCCELHSIYPTVGILKHSTNMSRYDSVLLNRLWIGHSRFTLSYLLFGDDPPTC